ncbi:MAG: 4-hydroxybenzoate octaprenyltransferase [Geminicoccaceae bacterium]
MAIGAVAMRGAGCTVNDLADRRFDRQVARTRNRPLAAGRIGTRGALAFVAAQTAVGALVLLALNLPAALVAVASLPLIVTYPFMKRVTYWPQAFLGITFNWGVLVGHAAITGTLGLPALLLYAAGFFWTLGYDTLYAHQDKEDDALIGVKSTALLLGERTPRWLVLFYGLMLAFAAAAAIAAGKGWPFWPGLAVVALLLGRQLVGLGWTIRPTASPASAATGMSASPCSRRCSSATWPEPAHDAWPCAPAQSLAPDRGCGTRSASSPTGRSTGMSGLPSPASAAAARRCSSPA